MMRRTLRAVSLALAIFAALLAGCSGSSEGPTSTCQDITAAQLETMMADGRPLIIVDVRSTSEFAAGHLPGSVNIPLDELPARLNELDASVRVVVVCGSGSRSVRGAKLLLDAGYRDVYNLIGGLATWNGELEKSG